MLSIRRWFSRISDRRPVVRRSRASYRRRRWRRSGRAWLLLVAVLIGVIILLRSVAVPA